MILSVCYVDYLLYHKFLESNISGFLAKIKNRKIGVKIKCKKKTNTTSKKYLKISETRQKQQ
jgi:hypothetical protein